MSVVVTVVGRGDWGGGALLCSAQDAEDSRSPRCWKSERSLVSLACWWWTWPRPQIQKMTGFSREWVDFLYSLTSTHVDFLFSAQLLDVYTHVQQDWLLLSNIHLHRGEILNWLRILRERYRGFLEQFLFLVSLSLSVTHAVGLELRNCLEKVSPMRIIMKKTYFYADVFFSARGERGANLQKAVV